MNLPPVSRREILVAAAMGSASSAMTSRPVLGAPAPNDSAPPFRFCLNMSTIRGQKLSVPDQIDLAAKAGYHAIEPWVGELSAYVQQGNKAADLRKRIEDAGLIVASAIGFAEWIVDDDAKRAQGMDNAK